MIPELALALRCCAWPFDAAAAARVRDAAVSVDWDTFVAVLHRHRIVALGWHALQQADAAVPEAVRATLRRRNARQTRRALALTATTIMLQQRLAAAGIPCAVLKGSALAHRLYGNIALRHSKDVDLLIAPEGLERAVQVLLAAGYRLQRPEQSPDDKEAWRQHCAAYKDCTLVSSDARVEVELHWRLFDTQTLMAEPPLEALSFDLRLGHNGAVLRTLAPDIDFLYLCVHGSLHGWARLKWLADIAALLQTLSPQEIEALWQRACEMGLQRCVGPALLLCDLHVAPCLPHALRRSLQRNLPIRLLAALALKIMSRGEASTELQQLRWGTTLVNVYGFSLNRSHRHRWQSLKLALHSAGGLSAIPRWLRRQLLGRPGDATNSAAPTSSPPPSPASPPDSTLE